MNITAKTILGAVLGFIAVFLVFGLIKVSPNSLGAASQVPFLVYQSNKAATTTAAAAGFMTPGTGTTTIAFLSHDLEEQYAHLFFTSSTSAARLDWQYQWSNGNSDGVDCSSVQTACEWYEEDQVGVYTTALNNVEHASTTITHRWNPGSTTAFTARKALAIPTNRAKYTRAQFFIPAGSTNGTLYVQFVKTLPNID